MDLLYTWIKKYSDELGCAGTVEHYHDHDSYKAMIDSLTDRQEKRTLIAVIVLRMICLHLND